MATVAKTFIIDKLKQFLTEEDARTTLDKARAAAGLPDMANYDRDQTIKLAESMVPMGGFIEFVARNLKIHVLLRK